MEYDLKNKLVVAVSSQALFNLEKENEIFEQERLKIYYAYQLANENKLLLKGTGFRLVENFLKEYAKLRVNLFARINLKMYNGFSY